MNIDVQSEDRLSRAIVIFEERKNWYARSRRAFVFVLSITASRPKWKRHG